MHELSRELTEEDVRDVVVDAHEPLTATEVAAALGCPPRAAYDALQELADRNVVESKRLNGLVRVWWHSPGDRATPTGGRDGPSATHHASEDILRAAPVSIVVFDTAGDVAFANEQATRLLGIEYVGTPGRYETPDWTLSHEDGTPMAPENHPIASVFETGDPVVGFEHWLELPDGTERWVWGSAAPVADDGPVDHVVVGLVDVTALKEREERLTSDRRRVLELSSAALFGPFLGAADGPFRVTVDEVVSLPDGGALEYVTASGLPAKALMEAMRQRDAVQSVRLLRSTGDECGLEVSVASPSVPVVFDDLGGGVVSLVEHPPDGPPALVAELPGDVDPRQAVRAVRQAYPDVELDSQELRYSPRLLFDVVGEVLTDRQFAALQAAYHGGYFETPRRSSGEELAEQLGITRQTFNQHLRKAERAVFEQLFEAAAERAT